MYMHIMLRKMNLRYLYRVFIQVEFIYPTKTNLIQVLQHEM